jgi:hypothetical protein
MTDAGRAVATAGSDDTNAGPSPAKAPQAKEAASPIVTDGPDLRLRWHPPAAANRQLPVRGLLTDLTPG